MEVSKRRNKKKNKKIKKEEKKKKKRKKGKKEEEGEERYIIYHKCQNMSAMREVVVVVGIARKVACVHLGHHHQNRKAPAHLVNCEFCPL